MGNHPRIIDYVRGAAEAAPNAEALVLDDVRLSYKDLVERMDAMARALLAAGVAMGDRVATLQTSHPDFLVAFLATASIGAVWVGLNPRYRLEELSHVMRDARPRMLIARRHLPGRDFDDNLRTLMTGEEAPERLVTFEDAEGLAGAVSVDAFLEEGREVTEARLADAREACGGRDPCLLVYTSGSTGRPKGALLHHEGIVAFCLQQNAAWPVEPSRVLNFLPINHIGSVIDVSLPTLVAGGAIVFMEQFDPVEALALIGRERLTVWGGVPSVFTIQLGLPEIATTDFSSLQLIVWEGAAMPAEQIARLAAIHPRLATNYGMTESGSAATLLRPTDDLDLLANSVGEPFPGVELRLAGPDGAPVPDGEPGEVQLRSIYNMLGYWNRPEATAEAFTADGFLRTGDLAVRRPDGRYRIVGRLKEMFKSGGYNVYPREVEAAIEAHPAVEAAAVVSRPDPVWQEVGVAFVLANAPVEDAELEAWARERLANYKIPKRFVMVDDFPLLPIGKVDRKALQARAADLG